MERDLFRQLAARLAAGQPSALATIVRTRGSTPQQPGARAIFGSAGEILGTIGGGCLEHEARRRALDALRDRRPARLTIDLTHDYDQDTGLICGGIADLVIEVPDSAAVVYRRLAELVEGTVPAALVVELAPELGAVALVTGEGETHGESGLCEVGRAALSTRRGGALIRGERELFVDLLLPPERLFIAGAGHVGRAVARLAALVEFEVIVIDDRPDLNRPDNIPWAAEHRVGDIESLLASAALGPEDYVVIVTRGHRHDADAVRAVIRGGANYVGLIGSRRKIKLIGEGLVAEGAATAAELARLWAPIGLDLGAISVDEIAISIVAELIAVRHGALANPDERPPRRRPARAGGGPGATPANSPPV